MERRFKQGISLMFRSCRSRNIPDIVHEPVLMDGDFHLLSSSSSKSRNFPFICRPKRMKSINDNDGICEERRRASDDRDGRMCPPASPVSPLHSFYKSQKKKKPTKKKNKKKSKCKETVETMLTETSSTGSREFFSSDDEREEESETFFSTKCLSSDSSEFRFCCRSNARKSRCRKVWNEYSDMGFPSMAKIPLFIRGKVRESVAVVKSSIDPYGDFRSSMTEMIMEKQIFEAKDLEQLLQCFLSLNSSQHHQIIFEVFSEIWEALFGSSS